MKCLWTAGLFVLAATASAEIDYRVNLLPSPGTLHVIIHLSHSEKGTRLQLPNWGPGGYVIRDASKSVQSLKATDGQGNVLAIDMQVEHATKKYQDGTEMKVVENPITTWTVAPAKDTIVEYDINSAPVDGTMHYSGPSTYLYAVDRRKEKCKLELGLPAGWAAYLGLDEAGTNAFTAKDYDTLADNPVTAGGADGLTVDSYLSRGKTHWIVMRGVARAKVDRANLLKACKFVSDSETDFFGAKAPYNKYIWHFSVNDAADGAGGLEHLSSTQISLAAGVGPRAVSVLAHEFFHLWNVKRIRSAPLGPFDYTKLPQTGAIWWLEGVTDYYAYTILHRYGWTDDNAYFATASSNMQIVARNPAHLQVSPNDSSMRVDESNGGHGNSNGYLISYYNLGWIAGMSLDLELRSRTGGKHTLDDVELALWDMCKDGKPGFAEGEIRKQYVRFGGDGATYDRIVMQPNMPVAEALAKAGLQVVTKSESYVEIGFAAGGGPGSTGLSVNTVRGPAEGKLKTRDQILAVNGTALVGDNGRALASSFAVATRDAVAGKVIKLTIKRGDETMEVEVTPTTASREVITLDRVANPTPEQKKLADAWLARKSPRP